MPLLRRLPLLLLASALAASSPGFAAGEEGGAAGGRLARIEEAFVSRNPSILPSLREWAARDPEEGVRERALGAMALLGDGGGESRKLFLSLLASDPSPRVRRAAADAIGFLSLPVSYAPLVDALQKDPSPLVRMEAARAMGRTGNSGGAPALVIALLQDPSSEVRALAAEALGRLKQMATTESLAWAAEKDVSTLVRIYALRALRDVSAPQGQPAFESTWTSAKEWDLRLEAYRGLLLGPKRSAWEEAGLSDGDERVRSLALRAWAGGQGYLAVGREGAASPSSRLARNAPNVGRLEKLLADPAKGVRETARQALQGIGYHVVAEGLSYRIDSSR